MALKGPSSTWTYVVSDEPFRQQMGTMLTGPGRPTFAIGAAIFAAPFFVAWALVDRFLRKRRRGGALASEGGIRTADKVR
jgi:hypothetical protein